MRVIWRRPTNEDWHIYYGQSQFLVAEGAGWSVRFGRLVYRIAQVYYFFSDLKKKKRA